MILVSNSSRVLRDLDCLAGQTMLALRCAATYVMSPLLGLAFAAGGGVVSSHRTSGCSEAGR